MALKFLFLVFCASNILMAAVSTPIGGGGGGSCTCPLSSVSSPLSISSSVLSMSVATSGQNGYLTAADFTTFNGKQDAGNYITALTGDCVASGPGSASSTIASTVVTGKVLTGFSAAAGTVSTTDSILAAFNKLVGNIALKANLASPNFTGAVTFGNYKMSPSENDAGNSGTTKTIDLSQAAAQKLTMTGNCTLTLSNPQSGGAYVLKLVQDATGSRTMTWPGTLKWSGGSAPTLTTTATKTDLVNLYYDGTNYYGSYSLNF